MNTRKKNKHRKGPKKGIKTKTQDGQAEVFVLPPDLLQKLGIDLGSVRNPVGCPTYAISTADDIHFNYKPDISDNGKGHENNPEAPKEIESQKDTTILETADLMKTSVFLSPTFVAADNIDSGELEISNVIGPKEIKEATHKDLADTLDTLHVAVDEPIPQIDKLSAIVNTQEFATVNSNKQCSLNPDSDIEAAHIDITDTMLTQVTVAETIPKIDKMSVIITVEQKEFSVDINNKHNTLNPDNGTEIPNSSDSNFLSLSAQDNYQMTVDSNMMTNVPEINEIKEAVHKIETESTQVTVEEPFSQIDTLSVIVNSKIATNICYKDSASNPDSDIEISNSSDSNFISQESYQIIVDNNHVTDIPEKCAREKSTEDHSDEAYMSDCSNRTSSPTENTSSVPIIPDINSHDFEMNTEHKNKVTIISEEILSPSKFKNIQNMLSPNKTSFIPVTMNCILETNKCIGNIQNCTNTMDNLISTCGLPPECDSSISYENKNLDLLALYDEKGNNISVIKSSNNLDIITDVKIENLSQCTENTIAKQDTAPEMHTAENHTFGDIDLVVIGMDIEENEDILENFVHEITSNDDNNILEKIEQSEKYCSPVKSNYDSVEQTIGTCTQSDTKIIGINNQIKVNTDELDKLAVKFNTTECLSNKIYEHDDKVLQVAEMVTNCNNNITDPDLEIKENGLNEVDVVKKLNFETEIDMKSNVSKINSMDAFSVTLNSTDQIRTEIDLNDINPIQSASNTLEEKHKSFMSDKTLTNELMNINDSNSNPRVLEEIVKHTENKGDIHLKVDEELENRIELRNSNKSNTMISAANDKLTTIQSISKEIERNTSEKEHSEKLNKVEEIAMYLSQFAKIHSEAGKMRRKSVTNMKIPAKRSKHNALTSKKYIQGVEKPGGSEKSNEDFKVNKGDKTYTRSERVHRRSFTRPLIVTASKESQNISISCYVLADSDNLIQESHKNPEFCLCGDFGRLSYYDSDVPYEHIHFWEHKLICCDRENVFSIFNEADNSDVDAKIAEIVEFPEECDQNSKTFVDDSICWHSCKKVPIPNQNDEIVSVIENSTNTKKVTVLSGLSKTEDTIEPVYNDDKSTLEAVCELQAESISIPVIKRSELLELDLKTSSAHSSPHDEINTDPALTVESSNENVTSKNNPKPSEASKHKTIEDVKDASTFKNELKEKIAKKLKAAKSFNSIKIKMESKESKQLSASPKNDSINVEKNTTNEIPTHSKYHSTRKEGTVDKSSTIDINLPRHVDTANTVDELIFEVEGNNEQQSNHITSVSGHIQEKGKGKKRRKSKKREEYDKDDPACKKSVKCDVCKKVLSEAEWESHISSEHCYIAWKSGSSFDFEDSDLLQKLQDRTKTGISLICTFCTAEQTQAKNFIKHVKQCFLRLKDSSSVSMTKSTADQTAHDLSQSDNNSQKQIVVNNSVAITSADAWVCGICNETVASADWMEHIRRKHEYLAWRVGDTPLNLDNKDNVRIHLSNLTKMFGELKCSKCGLAHRHPKAYMKHVRQCTGKVELKEPKSVDDIPLSELRREKKRLSDGNRGTKTVHNIHEGNKSVDSGNTWQCGVCKDMVSVNGWMEHIQQKHDYLAWKVDDPPLDLDNENEVRTHLLNISRAIGELTCSKCGLARRYPKTFMQHVQQCTGSGRDESRADQEGVADKNKNADSSGIWECGVCKEMVPVDGWMEHIKQKHEYLAWKAGEPPLDLGNEGEVRMHLLNISRAIGELTCSKCGFARRYPKTFMQHVQQCTGGDESRTNQTESPNLKTEILECGVCRETVAVAEWIDHIKQKHEYLAWKSGDPPLDLDNEEQVRVHLFDIVRITGGLTCSKCGVSRKYPKVYMQHIQQCTGLATGNDVSQDESLNTNRNVSTVEVVVPRNPSDPVKCAVCGKKMLERHWHQHILDVHQYMAWREGDQPLNMEDSEAIKTYLYNICKETGNLTCNKCGLPRKYVKVYLQHIESCTGPVVDAELNNESVAVKAETNYLAVVDQNTLVTCAVCHKEVSSDKWIQHIGRVHNYMAHHTGQTIDLNDQDVLYSYLYEICKRAGHLICSKCGLMRKYAKTFIQHTSTCYAEGNMPNCNSEGEVQETDDLLVCAVCSKSVAPKEWKSHKMAEHYNVAWAVGSIPVDIKNAYVVDMLLKEYVEKYKKMVCKVCNLTRLSRIGFYAHVIQCGKTPEEIDAQKTTCGICNKKYLYLYHNQHMTWHSQQEINVQRKLKLAEEQLQKQQKEETVTEDSTPGPRQAAQKAKNFIKDLKKDNFTYKCKNCNFGGDSKEEILNHVCKKEKQEDFSDSGESARGEEYSGGEEDEETEDDEIDSDISNEELEFVYKKKKKKKSPVYTSTKRFPFVPKDLNSFLKKAGVEFLQQHHNDDILFPNLRVFDCEPIPSDELIKYLPPLEESCKIKFGSGDWNTYTRFQVERSKCLNAQSVSVSYQCIFTGGYIQCVSWSRLSPELNAGGNFLAVACHRGSDVARLQKDQTPADPGLIQLWSFGDFSQEAELSLGIAHEYGSAWAMDWCPYGARDPFPAEGAAANVLRLGLLAVAFSSGTVAVFAIPYPASLVKRDKVVQKLKAVAELRQTMNPERQIFQATSVSWSKQKPYESIVVGYGDGTTAYFDLNTESPFLKAVENGIIVLYPYHDERVLNKCITGLDLYPSMDGAGPAGAACASSASGVVLQTRPGVRPAKQYSTSAIGYAQFEPLWPSAALVGDESNLPFAVNEIEWYGGGRRMGGGSAGAGCQHCGRFVLAASPLLVIRYPHPADNAARKQVAGILRMTPLAKKRKKLANDELQTIVEPITYDDAVRKYGIELRMDKESVKKAAEMPRETYPERFPERFPLGDVTSMAFCPDPSHHKKLAIATHSGMIFVLDV